MLMFLTLRIHYTTCRRKELIVRVELLQPVEEAGVVLHARVFSVPKCTVSVAVGLVEAFPQDICDFIREVS